MITMCRLFAALLISSFLICGKQVSAESQEAIKIGWIGPLSGDSAVLGIDSVPAAEIAIDAVNKTGGINGRRIELLVEDDQYDTAKSVSAYTKLVSQGVVALFSSSYGGLFAIANRAIKDRIIVINPLDCNNDIAALSENTFCIATESESIGRIILDDILQNQLIPAAVIYDDKNPFMLLVQGVIKSGLVDVTDPDSESYFAGVDQRTADFRSILTRTRAKGIKSIVFLGHDPMGLAMREARSLGITSQFYTLGTITSPGYQKLAGDSANGALVAYWEAPKGEKYQQFIANFKSRVGRSPILELASIPTYDSTSILIEALRQTAIKAGPLESDVLRNYIYGIKNYPGLSGSISMDADGAVRSIRESLYVFKDGKLTKK